MSGAGGGRILFMYHFLLVRVGFKSRCSGSFLQPERMGVIDWVYDEMSTSIRFVLSVGFRSVR